MPSEPSERAFDAGDRLDLFFESHHLALIVEPCGTGLLLALPERPYHRLHISLQNGTTITFKPTKGHAAAIWQLENNIVDDCVRVFNAGGKSGERTYLGINSDGALTVGQDACDFHLREVAEGALPSISSSASTSSTAADFSTHGYCMLRGLVPQPKIERALRLLNHHLGSASLEKDLEPAGLGVQYMDLEEEGSSGGSEEGCNGERESSPPRGVVKLGGGHVCTCSLAQHSFLLELLDATARDAIAKALESPTTLSPMFGCQVALRFPLAPFSEGVADGDAAFTRLLAKADWHTDAAKYNEKKRFDFVVGVFLSAVNKPSDGALLVKPGSQAEERKVRLRGALPPGQLHSGASCECEAILAEAGDVIVFDGDLVHAGGPNLASGIRYALYYRMRWA